MQVQLIINKISIIIILLIFLTACSLGGDQKPPVDSEISIFILDGNSSRTNSTFIGENVTLCYEIANIGEKGVAENIKILRTVTSKIPEIFIYPEHDMRLVKEKYHVYNKILKSSPIQVLPPHSRSLYDVNIEKNGFISFSCNRLEPGESITFRYNTTISESARPGTSYNCSKLSPADIRLSRKRTLLIIPDTITIEQVGEASEEEASEEEASEEEASEEEASEEEASESSAIDEIINHIDLFIIFVSTLILYYNKSYTIIENHVKSNKLILKLRNWPPFRNNCFNGNMFILYTLVTSIFSYMLGINIYTSQAILFFILFAIFIVMHVKSNCYFRHLWYMFQIFAFLYVYLEFENTSNLDVNISKVVIPFIIVLMSISQQLTKNMDENEWQNYLYLVILYSVCYIAYYYFGEYLNILKEHTSELLFGPILFIGITLIFFLIQFIPRSSSENKDISNKAASSDPSNAATDSDPSNAAIDSDPSNAAADPDILF